MKRITGVYLIVNTINNKKYIGSTSHCVYTRMHAHKSMLNSNAHHSRHLQNAWNKYGKDVFVFKLLKECSKNLCIKIEQYYIDKYKSYLPKFGYNVHPIARSPLGVKRSQETKDKLKFIANNRSKEVLERIAKSLATPEVRAKIGRAHRGKVLSQETKDKISKSVLAKVDSYRHKISKAKLGVKLSKEHKLKLSIASKGKAKSDHMKNRIRLYANSRPKSHQDAINAARYRNRIRKLLDSTLETGLTYP